MQFLPHDSDEPKTLGACTGRFDPIYVNRDGSLAVWTSAAGGKLSIVLCDGGERQTLQQVEQEYGSLRCMPSKDGASVVIWHTDSDTVFLKAAGKDVEKIQMPEDVSYEWAYYPEEFFGGESMKADTPIYLLVDTDLVTIENLYCVDANGSREKLLSNLREVVIGGGRIFYIDQKNDLYVAKLAGAKLSEAEKISSNAYTVSLAPGGTGICYAKNVESDGVGALYHYSVKTNSSTRITASASFDYTDLSWGTDKVYFATDLGRFSGDGAYVFYHEDIQDIGDTYAEQGTLYRYSIKDDSSERLATESYPLLRSGETYGGSYINANNFWGNQYVSHKDKDVEYRLRVFYNGQLQPAN